MDKNEALKLALEALEYADKDDFWRYQGEAITAIRQALAAPVQESDLSGLKPATQEVIKGWIEDGTFINRAVGAMQKQETEIMRLEKLAEQPTLVQQKSVSAMHIGWDYLDSGTLVATYAVPVPEKIAPKLYTSPPAQRPWVGLPFEEVCDAEAIATDKNNYFSLLEFARTIEAKLKEKNA
jgi:hypothetical protein